MAVDAAPPPSIPAWARNALRVAPVRPPIGHTVRAALCVGGPVTVGLAIDEVAIGVALSLASVLRTIGEREASHRVNATTALIATPIAACGYVMGLTQSWPLWALVAAMAAVAFVAGTLSAHGEGLSLGGMQLLLVASIALGTPDDGWLGSIGWFLAGAALYGVAMAIDDLVIEPHRPERMALAAIDGAVDHLEGAVGDGDASAVASARAQVHAALAAAWRVPPAGWASTEAGIARWGAYVAVVEAAGTLTTFLAAPADPAAIDERRAGYRNARADHRSGVAPPRPPVTLAPARAAAAPWWRRLAVDHDTRAQAGRLALCMAIAASSRAWVDLDHWFWVPATVALVMKPDFGSVFGRAVLRVAGTVVGAVIAATVVGTLAEGPWIGVAVGLAAATIPWGKLANYSLQTVAISVVILLLVEQVAPSGGGAWSLPLQRVAATAVGGAIVLVFGYLIWPSARRPSVAPAIGQATGALAAELRAASAPVPDGEPELTRRHDAVVGARRQGFVALASTRTPLSRAAAEPPPASDDAAAWLAAVGALEHLADAISAHAVGRLDGAPALADAQALADQVESLGSAGAGEIVERAAALADRIGSA